MHMFSSPYYYLKSMHNLSILLPLLQSFRCTQCILRRLETLILPAYLVTLMAVYFSPRGKNENGRNNYHENQLKGGRDSGGTKLALQVRGVQLPVLATYTHRHTHTHTQPHKTSQFPYTLHIALYCT
jgi:hypothetical protein